MQRFHEHLNRGEFDEICREADDALSPGEKRFDEVVHQVHAKFGNAEGARRVNLHVNMGTDGTFVIAQFNAHFAQTPAAETFTRRKSWNTLKPYGYRVRSDTFLK